MSLTTMPAWAQRLSEKYYSRTVAMFVLHGNVHDLVAWPHDGRTDYVPLQRFLNEALFGQRDILLSYDRGGGLMFGRPETHTDFARALEGYDAFHGTRYAKALPRNPDGVLTLLDSYLRLRVADGKKIALILDFAETLAPAGGMATMGSEDRNSLVALRRWARNPAFLRADVTICLVTEALASLHPSIVENPNVAAIHIPLPDEGERMEFIRSTGCLDTNSVTPEAFGTLSAGLKRIHIQNLSAHSVENRRPLNTEFLTQVKKELIEAESHGLLEFVESRYDLSMVAGHEAAKQKLRDAAAALRAGRGDVLPMGYVISGPVGTGKTFLTTCFAGEVGIPAVTLRNFRSMWQGETEANLERVLHLLDAMSPIAVIVDEADAQLGDRTNSGDSGVGNRVFAQIAQFMGNTERRGRVIWFLLTCRPDLVPVDLKRQGRAEEHIALFYPDTDGERLAMLRAMQRKTGSQVTSQSELETLLASSAHSLSGADLEAILVRARMRCALNGGPQLEMEDVKHALDDFIPPSYPEQIELQNLAAVLECTSRSLLPEKYRCMSRAELLQRFEELRGEGR